MDLKGALALIQAYPDFPLPGIVFSDIHPIMYNVEARKVIQDHLYARYKDMNIDVVVGLDSRGYYFGVPLADALKVPFVPARKAGKLPGKVQSISYALEYGKATIELQENIIKEGSRVVVVDDLMATGGTAAAACELVAKVGGHVVEVHVIVELVELNGRKKLPEGVSLYSLATF